MDVQVVYSPAPGPASGLEIVGWSKSAPGGLTVSLASLDAAGSASGTGDGGTIAENDEVWLFQAAADDFGFSRTLSVVTAGYTNEVAQFGVNNAEEVIARMDCKRMGVTPDTSVVMGNPGSVPGVAGIAVVLRGVSGTARFDTAALTATTSTTREANPPSITSTSGSLIIGFGAYADDETSNNALSVGANLTQIGTAEDGGSGGDVALAVGYAISAGAAFDPDAFVASGTGVNTPSSAAISAAAAAA